MSRNDLAKAGTVNGKKDAGSKAGEAHIDWNLEEDGTLRVEGSGRMPDLKGRSHAVSYWQDLKDKITKVEIGEGITEIGARDFEGCLNLTQVTLPSTLRRIRAYAFKNCTALREVRAEGRNFRYIHEKAPEGRPAESGKTDTGAADAGAAEPGNENSTLVFGTEAFLNVPWAVEYFGGLYCRDGVLYICFANQETIRIPKDIHTIAKFAFMNIHAAQLILPGSVRRIEDYAFLGAGFGKIVMPSERSTFTAGVYSGSLLESIGCESTMRREGRKIKVPNLYELGLKETKYRGFASSDDKDTRFRKLEIREKKETCADGKKRGVWGRKLVDVGPSIMRRLGRGCVIIGICWDDENRIREVKSFVRTARTGLINEYLMYPCVDAKDGDINIWSDSFTYQEDRDLLCAFSDHGAEKLMKKGVIRESSPDVSEEWFWSGDRGNYGGPLELRLLEEWLKDHPEVSVQTWEENEREQKYRMFVSI